MNDSGAQFEERSSLSGPIRRILVSTKYRFIGDTLLAVPLLHSIAEQWPEAQISLLTGAKAHELLKDCPYVHDAIEFDPYRTSDKGAARYLDLIAKLRKRRFDLAFVCNRSFHSALTSALAGARHRVGWSGFEKRDFLLNATTPYDGNAPEIVSYLDLLRRVAPEARCDAPLKLWVTDEELKEAESVIPRADVTIGLQPGATHLEKRWPPEKFADLAERLAELYPEVRFVLIGGPDERVAANAMLQACGESVARRTTSLVGALSLRETMAALTYLDLFIAGDTAIRHAAMALGTPTVVLFGPTSACKWGNADPPRHAALVSADHTVATITVDEVFAAAADALASDRCGSPSDAGSQLAGQAKV